ncbi:Uncharacterised protein [Bordetella pertussis]|nr:Uncharacterised protein [Bordetella pertussis]
MSSGVDSACGRASSGRDASVSRETISSRRAPVYRPSSKPYQRSLKKIWPLISPASGAPVSASLAFTSEWPVCHISGTPPLCSMATPTCWLHLTS